MQCGFFETDITASIGMERPATYCKIYHQAIHDSLKVRAGVFDNGSERVAVVGVDIAFVERDLVEMARDRAEKLSGIKGANIMIAASHTHSGGPIAMTDERLFKDAPELIKRLVYAESVSNNSAYFEHLISQIATAVCEADRRKEDVDLSFGAGTEDKCTFNRCFEIDSGRICTHPGKGYAGIVKEAGPIDPDVGVIGVWKKSGELLGCVVNFACHATCHGKDVSADWIYYMEKTVRGAFPGANVVFLNGACGDITQADNLSLRTLEVGEKWSRHVGTRVGAEALKVLVSNERGDMNMLGAKSLMLDIPLRKQSEEKLTKAKQVLLAGLDDERKTVEWTFAKERVILDYIYQQQPVAKVELQAIQIGAAILLSNPSEYFCAGGLAIKAASKFPLTMVVELANGCNGYVPHPKAFDSVHGGGYETTLSSYSNLCVEAFDKIKDGCIKLSSGFTPETPPKFEEQKPATECWSYGLLGPDLD